MITIRRCRGLNATVENPDGSKIPIAYDAGATIDVHVSVSDAGVELRAMPCVLTRSQARELAEALATGANLTLDRNPS